MYVISSAHKYTTLTDVKQYFNGLQLYLPMIEYINGKWPVAYIYFSTSLVNEIVMSNE